MAKANKILDLPFITHPLTVFTVLLLIVNDHYLKPTFANAITGKISDFCGLYFFPLLVLAFITIAIRLINSKNLYQPQWSHLVIATLITYVCFTGLQLSQTVASFYESSLYKIGFPSRVTRDSSDLMAFLSFIPLFFFHRNIGACKTN